jgi:hypothetical protein
LWIRAFLCVDPLVSGMPISFFVAEAERSSAHFYSWSSISVELNRFPQ